MITYFQALEWPIEMRLEFLKQLVHNNLPKPIDYHWSLDKQIDYSNFGTIKPNYNDIWSIWRKDWTE